MYSAIGMPVTCEVVRRTPCSRIIPNTGWSTPAPAICTHAGLAVSSSLKNGRTGPLSNRSAVTHATSGRCSSHATGRSPSTSEPSACMRTNRAVDATAPILSPKRVNAGSVRSSSMATSRCHALDEHLLCAGAAEGAILAVDPQHERSVEGMLLPHLDASARSEAERVEEGDDVGIRRPGHGHDGDVARLEVVERRHVREVVGLGLRDREAVRARGRAVEGDEDAGLDLLRQVVLERRGETVGFVPGVAEHVGQEALDDAVPADGADGLTAALRREDHALVQ